ncbi:FMRFamide receptor-like [Tubulanus polymorphus]|uniref:FMRFamide receptor-like n=1 Tax=Tubulanus polymorphus TaxID=672921 RepID=UPI003DA231B0
MDEMVNSSIVVYCPPIRTSYRFVHFVYVCGIGMVCLFGIVGNVLNLIVFTLDKHALLSINILKVLACCDMAFLIVCFAYFFVRHMLFRFQFGDMIFRYDDLEIGAQIAYHSVVFYYILQQTRNWITAFISVIRFVNIKFPFWARRVLTWKFCKVNIVFMFMVSIACNVPRYVLLDIKYEVLRDCALNEVTPVLVQVAPVVFTHYDVTIYFGFLVGFPMLILYATNLGLLGSVYSARSRRSEFLASSPPEKVGRSERQADKMVTAILLTFTICETPACIDRVADIAGLELKSDDFKQYTRKAGLLLVVLDSALNFLVYLSTNSKFRHNLTNAFSTPFVHITNKHV